LIDPGVRSKTVMSVSALSAFLPPNMSNIGTRRHRDPFWPSTSNAGACGHDGPLAWTNVELKGTKTSVGPVNWSDGAPTWSGPTRVGTARRSTENLPTAVGYDACGCRKLNLHSDQDLCRSDHLRSYHWCYRIQDQRHPATIDAPALDIVPGCSIGRGFRHPHPSPCRRIVPAAWICGDSPLHLAPPTTS
jgi:hypothetical protein